MTGSNSTDLSELPAAYRKWRESDLGRITDRIEEKLILDLIGPVSGKGLLDVGCGDGVLSVRLAQSGADVTGLDSEPRMLVAARRRANESGVQVSFIEGAAQALPLDGGSFDIVVAVTMLCFVADPEHAVHEMARVLRPGGRLVIGDLGRWSSWAARRRIAGWLGSMTWRAARFRTTGELRRLAFEAGLLVETVRGAVYYPPCNLCARWLSPLDSGFSRYTTLGAGFIALAASKPMQDRGDH
jgi:ubiquinone biosynthesis O-methyltransferase